MDDLQAWHKAYIVADAETIGPESPEVLAVEGDVIDHEVVERNVQQCLSATSVAQGFCQSCQRLFDDWPNLGEESWTHGVRRHMSTEELEAATIAGCKACSFMLTQMKDSNIVDTFRKIEQRLRRLEQPDRISLSIVNWARGGDNILLWINFPAKVTTGCNTPCGFKTIFQSHFDPPSTEQEWVLGQDAGRDPDSLVIAAQWLRKCDQNHEACRIVSKQEAPGRLVLVGSDMIQVINTSDMETLPPYATMSYCWGREGFYKLTAQTMDELSAGVSPKRLPQTFQDACYILQHVGLKHIWIDALCIIQAEKDESDWAHETSLMRSIYGNAYVNIAATSATSVHAGCFSKPKDYCGGFQAWVTTDQSSRSRSFYASQVYEQATSETILATRAWALQEKLLARRTLAVGSRGLFWECRSTIASEFLPYGFPGKLGRHLVRPEDKPWPWQHIVQGYSMGKLTFSSDKLPALSGIAKRQHEATGEEYLAGLWRPKLVKQLGWNAFHKRPRPAWRAPTWSWMSVDGEVLLWSCWDHENLAEDEYVQVLDAWTTPASANPFGAITAGSLRLRCAAMLAANIDTSPKVRHEKDSISSMDSSEMDKDCVILDGGSERFPVTMDCEEGDVASQDQVFLLPLFGGRSGVGRGLPKSDDDPKSDLEKEAKFFDEFLVRGMLLQNHGPEKGRFRRVGYFDFRLDTVPNSTQKGNHYYRAILEAIEQRGASAARTECSEENIDETNPTRRFVITIV